MTATEAVIAMRLHLISWPGLADIGNRVYNRKAPNGATAPYVVYQRISAARGYTHQGGDRAPRIRVQLVLWDTTPSRLSQLGDALVDALEAMSDGITATIETVFDREDTVKLPNGDTLEAIQVDAFLSYHE